MRSHEAAARAVKVAAILAVVPCGRSAEEIGQISEWLRRLEQVDRDALAAYAGVRAPSGLTWAAVVGGASARTSINETVNDKWRRSVA